MFKSLILLAYLRTLHIQLHILIRTVTVSPMGLPTDPLTGPIPDEIPLANAPLVRVISQIRFPEILSVQQPEFVAPFQEALRGTYPVLRREQARALVVGLNGLSSAKQQIAWRFSDVEGIWGVSLTADFVALETFKYSSRADFFDRLRTVLEALDKHVGPKLVDRLGVRYVDRIAGDAVGNITKLVRAEVCGISGTPVSAHATHALSETLFQVSNDRVRARWGRLPPGATIDDTIEPVEEDSWILDLDMFSASTATFDVDHVISEARRYAERIYALFRWAVTDDFLRRHGANL